MTYTSTEFLKYYTTGQRSGSMSAVDICRIIQEFKELLVERSVKLL